VKGEVEMKAYELMALAAKDPQKYEGKRYKVIAGSPLENGLQTFYECIISNGSLRSPNRSLYLATFGDVLLKEIEQPVSCYEAMKALDNGDKTVEWRLESQIVTITSKEWLKDCIAPYMVMRGEWFIKTRGGIER
jgi:hypothetical protein